jgi:hypothetical protein
MDLDSSKILSCIFDLCDGLVLYCNDAVKQYGVLITMMKFSILDGFPSNTVLC